MTTLAELLNDPVRVQEIADALEHRSGQLKEAAARGAAELDDGDDYSPVVALLALAGRLSDARRTLILAPHQQPAPTVKRPLTVYAGVEHALGRLAAMDDPAASADRIVEAAVGVPVSGQGMPIGYAPDGKPVYGVAPSAVDGLLAAADLADDPAEQARARALADLDRETDAVNRYTPSLGDLPPRRTPVDRLPVDRQVLAARTAAPDLDDDPPSTGPLAVDPAAAELGRRLRDIEWPTASVIEARRQHETAVDVTRHTSEPPLPPRGGDHVDDGAALAELDAFLSTETPLD